MLKHFYGTDVPPVSLTCAGASCRTDICPAAVISGHLDDFKTLFGLARIYGGIHYRNTIEASWAEGDAIAQNVIENFYTRQERADHEDDRDDDAEDTQQDARGRD